MHYSHMVCVHYKWFGCSSWCTIAIWCAYTISGSDVKIHISEDADPSACEALRMRIHMRLPFPRYPQTLMRMQIFVTLLNKTSYYQMNTDYYRIQIITEYRLLQNRVHSWIQIITDYKLLQNTDYYRIQIVTEWGLLQNADNYGMQIITEYRLLENTDYYRIQIIFRIQIITEYRLLENIEYCRMQIITEYTLLQNNDLSCYKYN